MPNHTAYDLVSRANWQNSQLPPLSFRASTAPGLRILSSQVNRCPGFLESILFSRSPANLRLKRSAGGSERLCDLIFSVNEACYECKGFPTGPEAFPAHHKPHRQLHGALAPCELKGPCTDPWGLRGGGERAGRGWRLPGIPRLNHQFDFDSAHHIKKSLILPASLWD